jgi:hypothetical protein
MARAELGGRRGGLGGRRAGRKPDPGGSPLVVLGKSVPRALGAPDRRRGTVRIRGEGRPLRVVLGKSVPRGLGAPDRRAGTGWRDRRETVRMRDRRRGTGWRDRRPGMVRMRRGMVRMRGDGRLCATAAPVSGCRLATAVSATPVAAGVWICSRHRRAPLLGGVHSPLHGVARGIVLRWCVLCPWLRGCPSGALLAGLPVLTLLSLVTSRRRASPPADRQPSRRSLRSRQFRYATHVHNKHNR